MSLVLNRFPENTGLSKIGSFIGHEEGLNSSQAMQLAGLDWTVSKRDYFYSDGAGSLIKDNSYQAIVNNNTSQRLGIVKANYQPIQNIDTFSFLDSLAENGDIRYHSAGVFNNDSKVWLMAKIGESEILPQDMLDYYLLAFNSHDGSSRLSVVLTSIRLFCTNMILGALRTGEDIGINIRHTRNAYDRMEEAKELLLQAKEKSEQITKLAKYLAKVRMPLNTFEGITEQLFPNPPEEVSTERRIANIENKREELKRLFLHGKGQNLPGVAYTGWAAFNAVTEYINHEKPMRKDPETRRIEDLLFGSGQKFISKAKNLILQAA